MEGKTRKENFIFHFREVPQGLRQDPIAFHLLAEYARRTSRTGGYVRWHGETIQLEPGQFITGRIKTSEILGITEGQYRGAFKRLVKMDSIRTIRVTSHYTICLFRAVNVFYIVLGGNSPANEPPTSPPANQPLTTNDTVDTVETVVNDTLSQIKKEKGKSFPYKQNPHSRNQRHSTGMTHISNALPTNIGKGVNKEWRK